MVKELVPSFLTLFVVKVTRATYLGADMEPLAVCPAIVHTPLMSLLSVVSLLSGSEGRGGRGRGNEGGIQL